jgi:hypothetical protein
MAPVNINRTRHMILGYPILTVAHQMMVKINIPATFIPIGVSGSTGGNSRKITKKAMPIAGAIHCLTLIWL